MLLSWIAEVTEGRDQAPAMCLWVNGYSELEIYPPAWFAHGIDPRRLIFVTSTQPLQELRPVFLSALFKLIILDNPKQCYETECLFLSRQARKHHQRIVVIRNHFLSNQRGNIAAAQRLNCTREDNGRYSLQMIKGKP